MFTNIFNGKLDGDFYAKFMCFQCGPVLNTDDVKRIVGEDEFALLSNN